MYKIIILVFLSAIFFAGCSKYGGLGSPCPPSDCECLKIYHGENFECFRNDNR